MTLDCPFRNPLQPRVISVRSYYLTSYGYLHFYWIRFATCSIQQLEFALSTDSFAIITAFIPQMWGPPWLGSSVLAVWQPAAWRCLSSRMPVRYNEFYWEMLSWTANFSGKYSSNPSWSLIFFAVIFLLVPSLTACLVVYSLQVFRFDLA